jgi:type 1 fimbria pilin
VKNYFCYAAAVGLLLCSTFTQASIVSVKGNVILPPCTLNAGNPINVDFGDDVMTTKIDGKSYKVMPVNYQLQCDGDMGESSLLQISIKGIKASFGDGLLVTDKNGLGVQFLNGSNPLLLNTGLVKFDYNGQLPNINAVLAKDPSATLTGGAFTATAVMYVDYQ